MHTLLFLLWMSWICLAAVALYVLYAVCHLPLYYLDKNKKY